MKKFFLCAGIIVIIFGIYMILLKKEIIDTNIFEMPLADWKSDTEQKFDPAITKVAIGERKTNEDQYQKVEAQLTADQQYLEELQAEFEDLHQIFQNHDFLDQNILQDGPDFVQTFAFLQESLFTHDRIKEDVQTYLSEESIDQRATDMEIEEEFMDVYKDYVEKYFSYLEDSYFSNLPLQVEKLQNIFLYLKEIQDRWTIYDKGILFDAQEYMDTYQELLKEFGDIQPVAGAEHE